MTRAAPGDATGAAAVLEEGRAALLERAWDVAFDRLSSVDPSVLTPRDLEGLADAAWWTSRFPESLDARQRAYAAYAAAGDDRAATKVAARLAIEHFTRDEPSVGAGYLMRAQRHAQDLPDCAEVAFLAVVEANVARFTGDLDRAVARAREAIGIAQRFGAADLVAIAINTQGLALVDSGKVPEGLALMDEAMVGVLAGGLDPYFTGIIYCSLIGACLELNDLRRAGEWSDAARSWCDTLMPDSPFPGMCRVNRAEVARLRGSWTEAEAEARTAVEELQALEPGLAGAAFVQIGEVLRRTGDLAGADAAFARAQELGADPQPGLALLRLAQGKVEAARSALGLALAEEHQPPRRARLLAAEVEAAIADHDLDAAGAAVEELDAMAARAPTPASEAAAATAAGSLRLAQADARAAIGPLRRAASLWQEQRLPYEAARTRVLCGRALAACGDDAGARSEYRSAAEALERLGAVPEAQAVGSLMRGPEALPGGLTPREAEVLRLVASGKTNRDIAVELVISEHTVARHLQNLFAKLGVSSRAAATAYAYEHDLA
jgi:DNA-binding CsgD family transcriptional regulator